MIFYQYAQQNSDKVVTKGHPTPDLCHYEKYWHLIDILLFCWHQLALHTHTRLTAIFPGLPGWAGTRKRAVKRMCVYLFPLLKSVSWEWFVDSSVDGLFVCLVLVLPEPVRSQSAGDVPRHVNRCGCLSDRVRRQECSHLGPRLRQLPQVHPCTRCPVRLCDCSIYIHTTATHV